MVIMKRSLESFFTNEVKWIKLWERNKFCIRKYSLWTSIPVKLFDTTTIWITSCTRQLKANDLMWTDNDVGYNALNTKQIPAIFSRRMNTVFNSNYIIRKDGIQSFPHYTNLTPIHSSNIWRNKSHFVVSVTRMCSVQHLKVSRLFPAKFSEMWNYQANIPLPAGHGLLTVRKLSNKSYPCTWQDFLIHCLTHRKYNLRKVNFLYNINQ
jgi:hypothetical protein